MNTVDLVIRNAQVYSNGELVPGGLAIDGGKIVAIGDERFLPAGREELDAGGKAVLPGVVDSHMHVRDPGHRERGTFVTESMACASAGVTTFLEHPISCPPPYSPEILQKRKDSAAPQSLVDYAFFGAAGSEFTNEIGRVAKEGIVAFKTFLHEAPEGRDEEFRGLTMANDGAILDGFAAVAETGLILTVHAENNDMIQRLIKKFRAEGKTGFEYHALSRPELAEIETVEKLIRFARETGMRIAFAHVSTPEAMELIVRARRAGQEVYLETCPHYLFLTDATIAKIGPFAKGNPPLRSRESMEKLWDYVRDVSVDYIGSDHSPFLLSEKEKGLKDIFTAAAGSPCVEMSLALMLTAVRDGKLTLKRCVELMSENAARIFGLFPRKGILAVGADADLVVVDRDTVWKVSNDDLVTHAKAIGTMYNGMELIGRPVHTVVRGRIVMRDRKVDASAQGWGKCLTPEWSR